MELLNKSLEVMSIHFCTYAREIIGVFSDLTKKLNISFLVDTV